MTSDSVPERENRIFPYEASLIVIRHQISRATAARENLNILCDPDKFDFSRRGAAQHSFAPY